MTKRAYLFLDVDGVLNPEALTLPGDWRQVQAGRFRVWTSARLGRWLTGLTNRGVQIVWATTWIEVPDSLAALARAFHLPTDLPRIDRLEWPDDGWLESGKRPGVQRWLDEHGVDPPRRRSCGPTMTWASRTFAGRPPPVSSAVKIPADCGLAEPGQRLRIEAALEPESTAGE